MTSTSEMPPRRFDGYREADNIDQIITQLINDNPIDENSGREWLKLSRTLQTTLKLVNHQVFLAIGVKPEGGQTL